MPADDRVTEIALAAIDADAAARALAGGVPSRPSMSVLYVFATDPAFTPPPGFKQALLADPAMRGDLRRLLKNLALHTGARQAAAASGLVTRRDAGSATMTLTPSRTRPEQAYLQVELTDPAGDAPTSLMLMGADGNSASVSLPPFADGAAQVLLSTADDAYRLFADPGSEAFLL